MKPCWFKISNIEHFLIYERDLKKHITQTVWLKPERLKFKSNFKAYSNYSAEISSNNTEDK